MSEIAFFPWFKLNDPVKVGDFELLIYTPDSQFAIQKDLDNIIGDFYPVEKRKVNNCIILKFIDKEIGEDFTEEERRKIFMFAELLTFSGLSARTFFFGAMGGYSNKDVYQIVVRNYESSNNGYKIVNRRRDGVTNTIVAKGATKTRKPKHIQSFIISPTNFNFLEALYSASQEQKGNEWNAIYESIVSFNLANTDSQYVREEMEIVLLFSSFERLYDVGKNTHKLYELINESISPSSNIEPNECERIVENFDESRYKKVETLRELWIRDFNNLRGNLAHGKYDNKYPAFWDIHEHLLFGSFILPICLKVKLSELDQYELTESDFDSIELFEQLLSIHPFQVTEASNPWIDLYSDYQIKKSIKQSFGS